MFYGEVLSVFGEDVKKGRMTMRDIIILMKVYNLWKIKFEEGEEYEKVLKALIGLLGKWGLDGYCIWELFDEKERRNLLGNYFNELMEKQLTMRIKRTNLYLTRGGKDDVK